MRECAERPVGRTAAGSTLVWSLEQQVHQAPDPGRAHSQGGCRHQHHSHAQNGCPPSFLSTPTPSSEPTQLGRPDRAGELPAGSHSAKIGLSLTPSKRVGMVPNSSNPEHLNRACHRYAPRRLPALSTTYDDLISSSSTTRSGGVHPCCSSPQRKLRSGAGAVSGIRAWTAASCTSQRRL